MSKILTALRERESIARDLYGKLETLATAEELPAAYRLSKAAEIKSEIKALNDSATQTVRTAAAEAAGGARARIAEGVRFDPSELQEASLLRDQYRDRPKELVSVAADALARGAIRKARIAYKAAQTAGVLATGRLDRAIADTDPEMAAAGGRLDALGTAVTVLDADIARERAAHLPPGREQAMASMHVKNVVARLGLPPSAAVGDQSIRSVLGLGDSMP